MSQLPVILQYEHGYGTGTGTRVLVLVATRITYCISYRYEFLYLLWVVRVHVYKYHTGTGTYRYVRVLYRYSYSLHHRGDTRRLLLWNLQIVLYVLGIPYLQSMATVSNTPLCTPYSAVHVPEYTSMRYLALFSHPLGR